MKFLKEGFDKSGCRIFDLLEFVKKMLILNDEHHTVTSSTVRPVKEKARCPKVFVFVKGMRKVLVSEME